jgi:hypothetical protein
MNLLALARHAASPARPRHADARVTLPPREPKRKAEPTTAACRVDLSPFCAWAAAQGLDRARGIHATRSVGQPVQGIIRVRRRLPQGILDGQEVPIGIIREPREPLEGVDHRAQPIQEVVGIPGEAPQGIGLGHEAGDGVVGAGRGVPQRIGENGEVGGLPAFSTVPRNAYGLSGAGGQCESHIIVRTIRKEPSLRPPLRAMTCYALA